MQHKKTKTRFRIVVALALAVILCIGVFGSSAAAQDDNCILQETMHYLVDTIGPRLTGTITELRACEYVKAQFEKIDGGDHVYEISLDEYLLNWVPAKGLQINPGNTSQYGYLFANDRVQYGVIEADIPSGAIIGTAIPNSAGFRNYEGGLFHDFGSFNAATNTVDSTPTESAIIAAGGKVYGTLRFDRAVTGTMVNNAIAGIKTAYTSVVDITGLFVARTDHVRTTSNAYGFTSNDLPAAVSSYTTSTTSVVGLSLADLEKAKTAGEAGMISKVYRADPETGWLAYARKPAADPDNPDLVMVFTSHIDTVRSSPGAQDTATGVTAAIELARRYKDVDMGNIELMFVAFGGEEYNDFSGATHIIDMLRAEGKDTVAINLNMDVMTSGENSVNVLGDPQDTYAIGTLQFQERYQFPNWRNASYGDNLGAATSVFNLPAHLLSSFAKDVEWGPGIHNVRIFNWGASDHAMFAYFGIDATRSTTAARGGNFSISGSNVQIYGWRYHSARDNMEDYSYERHLKATNLMANAIEKAMELEVTKRAKLSIDETYKKVTLHNASQLWKTYDQIEISFGNDNVTFTPASAVTLDIPSGTEDFVVTRVTASGSGISNHNNPTNNPTFTTKLFADYLDITPITSLKIDALSITTVARGKNYSFGLNLNEDANSDSIVWRLADQSLGSVDHDGTVTIFDKIGNVRLTATDLVSGISHSITLRIAS